MTEGEFLKRSGDLEGALVSGNLVEFCDQKIAQSSNETETTLWSFLKVGFLIFADSLVCRYVEIYLILYLLILLSFYSVYPCLQ